jgi:RNA polymerase sigma-70 factor (ECF subfamily)
MSRAAPVAPRSRTAPTEKFVRAFAAVRDELIGTLLSMLGSYDDAQDVAQEAFLKCWRARRKLRRVRNLKAWIFRIALNAARDLQRNAWRRKSRPLDADLAPPPLEVSPADVVVHGEALERLRSALLDLRAEEREVFLLRQNGELTYEQIATLRHRPVGTVKTQMRTALIKLRKVLQEPTLSEPRM